MKRFLTIFTIALLTASVWAQSPQKISYQSVVRGADGKLLVSTTVGMQVSILQGAANGAAVYVESQTPTTNENGLVSVEIGATADSLSAVDWANGPYFIKVEIDPAGGTSYSIEGVSEILSVPYAMCSGNADQLSKELMAMLEKHDIGTVSISASDAAVRVGVGKNLTAKPDFEANKFSWDFGDGNTADTTGASIKHAYDAVGSYNVSLSASSDVLSSSVIKLDAVQVTDTVMKDVQGNVYGVLKFGDQYWMASNLKCTQDSTGTDIIIISDVVDWGDSLSNGTIGTWEGPRAIYDKSPIANSGTLLYNYEAAKSACPKGWHLPSWDEWTTLKTWLCHNGYSWDGSGLLKKEAKAIASRTGWNQCCGVLGDDKKGCVAHGDLALNNATGLTLEPNATVYPDGTWQWFNNKFGAWWTSTDIGGDKMRDAFLYYKYEYLNKYKLSTKGGHAVRCLKN